MKTNSEDRTLRWLLAGDVSIRWQTMRDLFNAPRSQWLPEQSKVAEQGWGARLLKFQDETGRWTPRIYGKKWISTTYSMVLLRRMGLPPDHPGAVKSCYLFLDEALSSDGGIIPTVSQKRSETCVTGMVLALLSWFRIHDPRREQLVEYLLNEQMADGGWNCQRDRGAVHSSFHTTINVLEGLREYVATGGQRIPEVLAAEERGREFFLAHRLYRSHRTGRVVNPEFTRFSFPPRWHHDVLRTLDYFRASNATHDKRLEDPIAIVRKKRTKGGRWLLQNRHVGKTFFEMEQIGEDSCWNTLRALRVLAWWDRASKDI